MEPFKLNVLIILQILIFSTIIIKSQRTILDVLLGESRRYFFGALQAIQDLEFNKNEYKRFQNEYPKTTEFFCDAKNGPGKRSIERPTSIHKLRPGDVDIIAAMGDSMTAGFGIAGNNPIEMFIENRGLAWAIGGLETWRKYMTLPNILREFNANLYGFSVKDGLSTARTSRFNVAEGGAMSRDMPYQAKVLLERLKHDPKVDMANDWKILTLEIGGNDFCSDVCYVRNSKKILNNHERDIVKTLRFLRDNVPRLMVNMVATLNTTILFQLKGKPLQCELSHLIECPCLMGSRTKSEIDFVGSTFKDWIELDNEIVARDEFNSENFTVNLQPFPRHVKIPSDSDGLMDLKYFFTDCFHFSQKLHEKLAIALWNNILQPNGMKDDNFDAKNMTMLCPTEARPFLATRENSVDIK